MEVYGIVERIIRLEIKRPDLSLTGCVTLDKSTFFLYFLFLTNEKDKMVRVRFTFQRCENKVFALGKTVCYWALIF